MKKVFLFLCIGVFSSINAQSWNVNQYTIEEGLLDNYTYDITFKNDSLLIATAQGISVFDSQKFTSIKEIKNKYPLFFIDDLNSLKYIGFWKSGMYNIRNKKYTPTSVIQTKLDGKISKRSVKDYAADYIGFDSKFLLTQNNRLVYDSLGCSKKLLDKIFYDKNYNNFIVGSGNSKGIFYAFKNVLYYIDWKGNNKKGIVKFKNQITSVLNFDDKIVIGLNSGLIYEYKKSQKKLLFKTKNSIKKIFKYDKKSFLVVTKKGEKSKLNRVFFENNLSKLNKIESLLDLDVSINNLYVKDKIIFCSTFGGGIYSITPSIFKTLDYKKTKITRPKFINQDTNNNLIYFSSLNTLYSSNKNFSITEKYNNLNVSSFFKGFDNKLYLTIGSNLFDINLNKKEAIEIVKPPHYINDSTFIGFNKNSVFTFNTNTKNKNDFFKISSQNIHLKKINTISHNKNLITIATDNGIVAYRLINSKLKEDTTNLLTKSFKNKRISNIEFNKGKYYILSEGKIFTKNLNSIDEFKFSKKEDVNVNTFYFDSKNSLYIGTNKGFWYKNYNNIFFNYNKNNGLKSNNIYNFFEDNQSRIWITTGKSIEVVNPNNFKEDKPPNLYLINKKIDSNNAIFKIGVNQFKNSNDLQLEYKLNDNNWIPLSINTSLNLPNLNPENYTILFRGKKANSKWSISKKYQFKIPKKWYQTKIFRFLTFLLVIAFIYYYFKLRIQKIKSRNNILELEIKKRKDLQNKIKNLQEEISQDFHDELGNKISSISILSSTIKPISKKDDEKVSEITKLSSEVYDATKNFVWFLNPENNNLKSLSNYLRDYGEHYFDLFDHIDFHFYQENLVALNISYDWTKNIILTFKEITSNTVKHSNANKVVLDMRILKSQLIIKIYDNGQGFIETNNGGNGIKNIHTRMKRINAIIETNFNNGSLFIFKIPIDNDISYNY